MTVTINLPPDKGAALRAQAQAKGLSVEEWLLQLAEQAAASLRPGHPNLVEICAMVGGSADDLNVARNPSTGRTFEL